MGGGGIAFKAAYVCPLKFGLTNSNQRHQFERFGNEMSVYPTARQAEIQKYEPIDTCGFNVLRDKKKLLIEEGTEE